MAGDDRTDQARHSGVGGLLSQGGGATALPSARRLDGAAPLRQCRQAVAQYEGAEVFNEPIHQGVGCSPPDPSDAGSCPTMRPGRRSPGKRLAGKRHEPFERADGGRATSPNLFRLYTEEACEQRSPQGTGGAGGGKGAGQGERGGGNQEPDTAPGSPVTCAQPRTAGTCGCLHVDPRQEPGAVVPHAGIRAGGAG